MVHMPVDPASVRCRCAHLTSWSPGSLGRWAVRVCEQKTLPGRYRGTGADPTHPLALTPTQTLTRNGPDVGENRGCAAF